MIPKIIHYCWFGRNELPESAKRYIETWKKFLPDYELKLWNEDNFDIKSNRYVQEAYESRKFAFVTDFVRLYALHTVGGVYMDTDVEVLKSYNDLLHLKAFSGFERDEFVPTGTMASEKDGNWVGDLLKHYDEARFILPDGTLNLTTNTEIITAYMIDKGLKLNNTLQKIDNLVTMYPTAFFCPYSPLTGKKEASIETYCIHHFANSWAPKKFQRLSMLKKFIMKFLNPALVNALITKSGLRAWKVKNMN